MKYKALICDVDGTLIEGKKDAKPSARVKDAIQKAQGKIHVGIATARPFLFVKELIEEISLSSPCILGNGVQIYDPRTKEVLIEHPFPIESLSPILQATKDLGVVCMVQETGRRVPLTTNYRPHAPLYIFVPPIAEDLIPPFVERISAIPNVTLHKMVAWDKDKIDYLITSPKATKQHAILEVAKILKIQTSQIIAVGDGYNDFPLLMAAGLKIAMGNAIDDLKEIADYIAPSVTDDGVAHVIEKFVLQEE